MELQITALQTAVAEADARARQYLGQSRLDAAESGYETLLLVVAALLAADAGAARGWQRAALTLADMEQRILLDALAPSRLSALQLRSAALLDLPDVLTVGGITDVQAMLSAAINVGAPRYNDGDIRGCCVVYWSTAQTVLAAPALRGSPGHARALGQLRAVTDAAVPPLPLDRQGIDDLAWALRRAFDAILAMSA